MLEHWNWKITRKLQSHTFDMEMPNAKIGNRLKFSKAAFSFVKMTGLNALDVSKESQ